VALALASGFLLAGTAGHPQPDLSGHVRDSAGNAVSGVFITAERVGTPARYSTRTAADGSYELAELPTGEYSVRIHGPEWMTERRSWHAGDPAPADLRLEPRRPETTDLSAAAFLDRLPDGEDKRSFILDCTGCHTFNETVALPDGAGRTTEGWIEAVSRMLGNAGPSSSFPVISMGRDPAATARFLTDAFQPGEVPAIAVPVVPHGDGPAAVITEFAIPEPMDLPHDLAVTADGRIAITGMFTHRLYVLDPAAAEFRTIPIPVANANPRAIEIDVSGDWWVLLGAPMRVARYRPSTDTWDSWPIGMYPHSIGVSDGGRVWFNGHFTRQPELIGRLDADGAVTTDTVPAHPRAAGGFGPIPYELRIAPDGTVWVSELAGNRVFSYDPDADRYRIWDMPTPVSGPRRLDVGPDGIVWIPEYANNALARLDPASGEIQEIPLPVDDATPYVVRVDSRSGDVWIGTGSADAILRYDPGTRAFDVYPLPTRGAMTRHLAIDPRNGDVWAAYGASPGIPSSVARLRLRD
jgi:virginiamycin B lyase